MCSANIGCLNPSGVCSLPHPASNPLCLPLFLDRQNLEGGYHLPGPSGFQLDLTNEASVGWQSVGPLNPALTPANSSVMKLSLGAFLHEQSVSFQNPD